MLLLFYRHKVSHYFPHNFWIIFDWRKLIWIRIIDGNEAIAILGAYHGMRAVGTLAKQGRVYIRTNIDKAIRQARVGFATAIVGGIVDALFLVYGGSVGSWIAAAADYADRWAGSYGYDGYILA